MREITCCFTGHRKIAPSQQRNVDRRLGELIEKLIKDGFCRFAAGGALGFDTMAAQCVLNLNSKYPNIKLILILPCLEQTKGWSEKDVAVYDYIKNNADDVIYTSLKYTKGCMFKRNRALVDKSSVCIAYQKKSTGGTAYTVNYAASQGVKVYNIGKETP